MDLISDILRDLRLKSAVLSIGEFRAPWGVKKAAIGGAPFHVVVEGRCLLALAGQEPLELIPGDLIILPHGSAHALMSETGQPLTPFQHLLEANGIDPAWSPDKRTLGLDRMTLGGDGPMTRLVNGVFAFRDPRRNPLLDALPELLHVRGGMGRSPAWLERSLGLLVDETLSERPGFHAIVERVADIIFVQAVREHLASASPGPGWLRGLADPGVARALTVVHTRPDDALTVASLARAAGMSRSAFAERFRALLGTSVMDYVTARRMYVAAGLLIDTRDSLLAIANAVGYESDISFSKAFRRWAGLPPGQYRHRHRRDRSAAMAERARVAP